MHKPLSDEEMAELDGFLLSDACHDEALSIDEVHGLFTALVVAGVSLPEGERLTIAWGNPSFPDSSWEEKLSGLMARLYQTIEAELAAGVRFEPLAVELEEEGDSVVAYEGWCFGFMIGVELQQESWDALPKAEQGLLTPIAQLALLNSEEPPDMDEEEYAGWVELLPGAVAALYAWWH